ncbi:branched-chain amino acid ABC transporter permease [Pleurocapsales cyanobacterium LEGE 06147]|nr:branched-chain amino acid ABC transporter permease [Pleurocapsales cyanobacterium LEGE 06147]
MVGYLVFLTISTALFALFALGLNLQWGFTGLINFGHVAFMTVGAYTTVLLSSQGVPLVIAVIIGAAIASLLGLAIGMSTLRLREDYLAIITIGVSELLRLIALNEEWLTKGAFGVQRYPLPLAGFEPNLIGKIIMIGLLTFIAIFTVWQLWRGMRNRWREGKSIKGKSIQPRKRIGLIIWSVIALALILTVYVNGVIAISNYYNYKVGLMLIVLLVLTAIYWGLELLVHSPWGRVLKSIREDEEIPRALGKNVFWYKLQALMLGGAIAGIAGAFYAWQLTSVYPANFEPLVTFNAWTIVVLGGAGNNAGTLLGAVIFWAYDVLTREYLPYLGILNPTQLGPLRIMVIGLILMLLMVWRPQGILGKKEELTLGR